MYGKRDWLAHLVVGVGTLIATTFLHRILKALWLDLYVLWVKGRAGDPFAAYEGLFPPLNVGIWVVSVTLCSYLVCRYCRRCKYDYIVISLLNLLVSCHFVSAQFSVYETLGEGTFYPHEAYATAYFAFAGCGLAFVGGWRGHFGGKPASSDEPA